jgi:hypothetical protein
VTSPKIKELWHLTRTPVSVSSQTQLCPTSNLLGNDPVNSGWAADAEADPIAPTASIAASAARTVMDLSFI